MEGRRSAIPIRVKTSGQDKDLKKISRRYGSISNKEGITKVLKESTNASCSKQNVQPLKQRSRILSDTFIVPPQKKLKTEENIRAPLIDLDSNIIKTSEVKKVGFRNKSEGALTSNKDLKINQVLHVDKTKITVNRSLTPHPKAVIINDAESDTDEVFVDRAQHYLSYKSESSKQNFDKTQMFLTALNGNKQFSPIRSNTYAAKSTIISQGIPEKIKRPRKKFSLLDRHQLVANRQSAQLKYLNNYYNTEYLKEILLYQLKNDWKYIVARNFLKLHNSHNNESRIAVINWIIQAQDYFNLPVPMLFTTIRLFDKLLENIFIPCNMCQLIGLVITWIIYKYEDDKNNLTVSKMLGLCNGTYTAQQFLKMEKKILTFFNFDINIPDVTIYMSSHLKELKIEDELVTQCAYYILECYALTTKFSATIPSVQAAAAVCLTLKILYPSSKLWDGLEVIGYYAENEISDTVDGMLHQIHKIQDPEYKYRQPYHKYFTKERQQASIALLQKLVAS